MELLSSSIVVGFLRLCFILLFFYYLNRKYVNRSESNNFIEFVAHQWFRYGSVIAIMLFVTVQLSIYSLFNCLILLSLIVVADMIGLRNLVRLRSFLHEKAERTLFSLLKKIELRRPMWSWFAPDQQPQPVKNSYYILILVGLIGAIIFGSRYYFIRYDMYSLSGVWLTDLEKVKDFDFQIWSANDATVAGEFAFINFYSKLTDVSPEIALQSMALLQSTLIGLILFWLIRASTSSKTIAPVVAALSFALAYVLTPVNIYFLLQGKAVFLALTLALPAMVYLLKPSLLKFKKKNYFVAMLSVFLAIGFIDLFTLVILLPPFLMLAIFFTKKKSKAYFWHGLIAYAVSVVVLLVVYYFVASAIRSDLETFLHSNLISISSYTYIPQLIIPFDVLIGYFQIISLAGIVLLLVYKFILKEKNLNASFAFLLYFNALVAISRIPDVSWLDLDLMNEALSVLMHIVVGINIAIVLRMFKALSDRAAKLNPVAVASVMALMLYASVHFQKNVINKLDRIDTTPKQVLDAYDKISTTFFPFSYAVVNDNNTQAISTNKHYFMNYTDFLYEYPKQDSIYFANIKDPNFLKLKPEYALPKSVLLFVFSGKSGAYGADGDISELLLDEVRSLQKKGRQVKLFYRKENVSVYEIINEPGESKVVDLIL